MDGGELRAKRRAAMAVLAHSNVAEIERFLEAVGRIPEHEDVRAPENGLIMVRGRIGGDGAAFNLGEATVSRAVIRLVTGEVGFGYVLGRDRCKARLIALCDALVQTNTHDVLLERHVIAPICARLDAERDATARRVAATKVEFFTLVRGEN